MSTGRVLRKCWSPDRSEGNCTSSTPSPCSSEAMQYRRIVHSIHCENENVSLVKTYSEHRSEVSSMPLCVLEKQLLDFKISLPKSKGWEKEFSLRPHPKQTFACSSVIERDFSFNSVVCSSRPGRSR